MCVEQKAVSFYRFCFFVYMDFGKWYNKTVGKDT